MKRTHFTIDRLRKHLQWALELEHSTLPPYLCALYSIKPGHNREASFILTSVLLEEMLHLALVANVLNAVGGAPSVDKPDFIPRYPGYLGHSSDAFLVHLAPLTRENLETFLKIEKPEEAGAPPEEDRFDTIGQFYQSIEEQLKELCAALGEKALFCGDPARQFTPENLDWQASGRVVPVYDLASALAAIDEIEEQGEGLKHAAVWDGDRDMFHPEREEVAHYFRFQEILAGRRYKRGDTPASGPTGAHFNVNWDAVYPMRPNPRMEDYPQWNPVRVKMLEFNLMYSDMLRGLQRAFNGEPHRLFLAVAGMVDLRQKAQELMRMPTGDGSTTAGPSFEYVERERRPPADPEEFRITIRRNGPYVVEGGVPLGRKSIVYSELHEPLTWRTGEALSADEFYRLCRCGKSAHKPFCDAAHARSGFDGTETAETSGENGMRIPGARVTLTDTPRRCAHAGFCGNRVEKVWDMVERTDDTRTRFQMMQMVERCPSGRLGYELEEGPIEPDLPRQISVTKNGPYWVTGGVRIEFSDGRVMETRNRVTLCRCGRSSNKPFCDGTHSAIKFREG